MSTLLLYSLLAATGIWFMSRNMRREVRLLLVLCALLVLNGPAMFGLYD